FTAAGYWSNSIPRKNATPLSVTLHLDMGGSNWITGQLSDGAWTAELLAPRVLYSLTNPAPAGNFTLAIPGSSDSSLQPGGNGYGTVSVDALGRIKFAGRLGDGTVVSQQAVLTGQSQWPLYLSLYSGNGSILGWLSLLSEPTNDITGTVNWLK